MLIFDSDILTLYHKGHARLGERMRDESDTDVQTTIISRIELLRGRFDSVFKAATDAQLVRAQELLDQTERLLGLLPVLPVDLSAARQFTGLLKVKGLRKIRRGDILIASIALARNATLVTRNTRDFSLVPGLKIVNWAD